ncbi:HDOD domain-containing protein [Uliginosibacterium aquaticum]|uniref:HDOD domain-containing protein n=1 Tax=Uliginosibacterium aquaticum TaxID=2731212 RepID=A0ABX2IF18_9RHOO|nr:HDOD domain-containing protein [Uliginosibacterium aquaticum]NSL55259.1 HDOD domain-containing protein [Uliginosibacterium aquaticum]
MSPENLQTLAEVDEEVARLVSSGIRIPPQPKIVQEVLAMLQANQLDLREMAETISADAGLTAMLYKITRSAAFARRRAPQSVEQILALVGIRQAAQLVQCYGLTTALPGNVNVMNQFWVRSGEIAQLASVIAHERVAVCNIFPEQAYMAGIFHDCGVPVLMQRFPGYCNATGVDGRAQKWADVREEDRHFQVDHCSIGYLLARHWRLPDFVAQAIRNHHDLQRLNASASRSMAAVLQLAIQLYLAGQGLSNPEWVECHSLVLDDLGLHSDDLQLFCDEVLDLYHGLE